MKVNVLRTTYAGAVWAMKKWYEGNDRMTARMSEVLQSLHEEFGWTTKPLVALFGRYIYTMLKREEKRLARGWVYEPASFYEKKRCSHHIGKRTSPASQNANASQTMGRGRVLSAARTTSNNERKRPMN